MSSILYNPGGDLQYVANQVLAFNASTFVEALAYTGKLPGYDVTLETQVDDFKLNEINGQLYWTINENDFIGQGCRAQGDLYTRDRLDASWLPNPADAFNLNLASVCSPVVCSNCNIPNIPVNPVVPELPTLILTASILLLSIIYRIKNGYRKIKSLSNSNS